MSEIGTVSFESASGVGRVTFFHPKANSFPSALLTKLEETIALANTDKNTHVIVLQSKGDKAFCSGASFDELQGLQTEAEAREFFLGFARVILAIRRSEKFVIARVHGKVVGGGMGIVSATDYALASHEASIKLSELSLGIGPFVVGPAVERKMGIGAFSALTIDTDWRDALWATERGLYAEVFPSIVELDEAVTALALKLSEFNPVAMAEVKQTLWRGTENWEDLLPERAAISARLIIEKNKAAKAKADA